MDFVDIEFAAAFAIELVGGIEQRVLREINVVGTEIQGAVRAIVFYLLQQECRFPHAAFAQYGNHAVLPIDSVEQVTLEPHWGFVQFCVEQFVKAFHDGFNFNYVEISDSA